MAEALTIDVVAKTLGIQGLADLRSGFDLIGKAVSGVTGFIKENIKAASDSNETYSKFNTVFKEVGSSANKMANELSDSFGLSSTKARQLLGDTGDMLSGFGFASESALELSGEVQKLAVDLASFTNYSGGAEGASEALTKGLLGEREMMKSLGIAISEELLKEELVAQGKDKLTGMALKQAKAEATLKLAMDQSKNALGDYARTSDQYANLGRQMESVNADIAGGLVKTLLPGLTDVKKQMLDGAKAVREFTRDGDKMGALAGGFSTIIKAGQQLGGEIWETAKKKFSEIKDSIAELIPPGKESETVFMALSVAGKVMGIALSIIIKSIGILIKGTIDLIKINKDAISVLTNFWDAVTGKKKWSEVGEAVKNVGSSYKEMATNIGTGIADLVSSSIDEFKKFPADVKNQSEKLKETFKSISLYENISEAQAQEIIELITQPHAN